MWKKLFFRLNREVDGIVLAADLRDRLQIEIHRLSRGFPVCCPFGPGTFAMRLQQRLRMVDVAVQGAFLIDESGQHDRAVQKCGGLRLVRERPAGDRLREDEMHGIRLPAAVQNEIAVALAKIQRNSSTPSHM